jgi:hypothetical protein
LNPSIAPALRLAGWDIVNVMELFGVGPRDSVPDDAIIPRCAVDRRIWITADERAQRQHELSLKQHFVSAMWVRRPRDGMSTAYQHAHLAAALLRLDFELSDLGDQVAHFELGPTLHAVPKEIWKRRR